MQKFPSRSLCRCMPRLPCLRPPRGCWGIAGGDGSVPAAHQDSQDFERGPNWTTDFDELDNWCHRTKSDIEAEAGANQLRAADLVRARFGEFRAGLFGKQVRWKFEVLGINPTRGTLSSDAPSSRPGLLLPSEQVIKVNMFPGVWLRGSRGPDIHPLLQVDFDADTMADAEELARQLHALHLKYGVPFREPTVENIITPHGASSYSKDFFRLPREKLYNLSVGRYATVLAKIAEASCDLEALRPRSFRNVFYVKLANARIE
jgi:hypothetical protein